MNEKSSLEHIIEVPEVIRIGRHESEISAFLDAKLRGCKNIVADYSERIKTTTDIVAKEHLINYVSEKEYEIEILLELIQSRSAFREAIARKIGNISLKHFEIAFTRVKEYVEKFNQGMEVPPIEKK